MTTGDRVKMLRERKGMTQEELANKLGYKSKTSVAHIEAGRDIPRSMVVKLAEILETTPAYLMGWEDEKTAPEIGDGEPLPIKATKAEWREILGRMSDENRQRLEDYAELLLLKQDQGDQED